jgi:alanine racemase
LLSLATNNAPSYFAALFKGTCMVKEKLNSWLEISESAHKKNMDFFKQRIPVKTEFSVVIKSNAYGHGMQQMAGLAAKYGADSFCVHSLEEALSLRNWGFRQNILIMGPVLLQDLDEVIANDLRLVVYNSETIDRLKKLTEKMSKNVRIHLKLETGTYRQGIDPEDLSSFLERLERSPRVKLEGAYTHFANIEDTISHDYAFRQLDLYNNMAQQIEEAGFSKLIRHTACSAAILLFPETYFDMVRLGISQYGLWPSRETFVSYKIRFTQNGEDVLSPVLSWKTRIAQIKRVRAGERIGYGGTYQTTRNSRIAVLPIGYADGYDRGLSNQAYVLINGKRAPIRGRICMNLFMVDITDIPEARLEDEVVLLGRQGKEVISADLLASLCGTINYELVTRINWQIPRIIVV